MPAAGADVARDDLVVNYSNATGMATFVTPRAGKTIPVTPAAGRAAVRPADFLEQHGRLFGVTDAVRELVELRTSTDALGQTHTTYRQVHEGIEVFSGTFKVHQAADGEIVAANADFYPIPDSLDTKPTLSPAQAASVASDVLGVEGLAVDRNDLMIVDPGWYGDRPIGARLAYHVIVAASEPHLREAFFIDAHSGAVLDQWNLIQTAKFRDVKNRRNGTPISTAFPCRDDLIDPIVDGTRECNRAFDFSGDFYDFLFRGFGRDGWDAAGGTLFSIVNHDCNPQVPGTCSGQVQNCGTQICPNAFWDGAGTTYCTGLEIDDVVGHEFGHALTQATAALIYQNQPGQLNEAYSDIWGEMVDLFNGDVAFPGAPAGPNWPIAAFPPYTEGPGTDLPNILRPVGECSYKIAGYPYGVRWLLGEDSCAFNGPIRDMWEPTCFFQPDRAWHELQTCGGSQQLDNGGVHSGSGVPNHAFAIMVDGKTFNGRTITAIGPIKASAVWYRALTVYLLPASDFKDAYLALNQAALDLVGTTPIDPRTGDLWNDPNAVFTAFDAEQVDHALLATEMHTNGACGAWPDVLSSADPGECQPQLILFEDGFEGGPTGWTLENTGPATPYDWELRSDLPFDRGGTAWFVDSRDDLCGEFEPAIHSLISPSVFIPVIPSEFPAHRPKVAFAHYLATPRWQDGGNVKISINGGAWQLIEDGSFDFNRYNETLVATQGWHNPMVGQRAWSGSGGVWGTSVIDLGDLNVEGTSIRLRFDYGKDGCRGLDGWYVDDFRVYFCVCGTDAFCDDGIFCNGAEACVDNFCQKGSDPCDGQYCSEQSNTCTAAAFWDNFENGNVKGWELASPDNTVAFPSNNWLIGDPVRTLCCGGLTAQPENAYRGIGCAYTGLNSSAIAEIFDVDDGITYLVSPTIDLSGSDSATLSFARRFFQGNITGNRNDFFAAEISSDGGNTWVQIHGVDKTHRDIQWTPVTVDLEDFIDLPAAVKLRFAAACEGPIPDDIVEAAVDEVLLTASGVCLARAGDADGNCVVNLLDFVEWNECFSGPGGGLILEGCEVFDFEPDNDVDLRDLKELMSAFEGL